MTASAAQSSIDEGPEPNASSAHSATQVLDDELSPTADQTDRLSESPSADAPETLARASHSLTNLFSGHAFELTVSEGEDVVAAARQRLREEELSDEVQRGFYVSVFPASAMRETDESATVLS